MEEILNEIESAYKMISTVSVSGDNVDLIAAARAKLRKVHQSLTELNNNKEQEEV